MRQCILFIYNSFEDPLFQNLFFKFIQIPEIQKSWRFHLITFEQPEYKLSISINEQKKVLERKNIVWYPQRHLTGRFLLLKKLSNVAGIFLLMFKLRVKGISEIWAFANVAASISYIYKKIFGYKLLIYSYEPHSAFMKELGLWSEKSLKFKILNYIENKAGLNAEVVMTGTSHMVKSLLSSGAKGNVYRMPTLINEKEFFPRENGREYIKNEFNIPPENKVILYIGKFGGLYYGKEIGTLFRVLHQNIPNLSFVVVSQTPRSYVEEYMNKSGFPMKDLNFSNFVSYEEVKLIISGSNLGISAVPPSPSQKFRSPTKVGEYLLCGIPYLTCTGVSEDDYFAHNYEVGVSLKNFEEESILLKIDQIRNYIYSANPIHYRRVGIQYRGYSKHKKNLVKILNAVKK